MGSRTRLPFAGSLAAALLAALAACTTTEPGPRTGVAPSQNRFLHAEGRDLVDGQGLKIILRGICFGNDVWANRDTPTPTHHGEAEFRYIRSLGMNAVRFYLSYRFFEDDAAPFEYKAAGFAWLDQNFAWARKHGVYLILNMHVPQGGWQSVGGGGALWHDPANQQRFTALWRAIARRYRDEPALAGYDLLNEPMPTRSLEQWERLAAETVRAIREEDPEHAVFVERVFAVGEGSSADYNEDRNGRTNYVVVNDTNVVYEFHFYKPLGFTYQGAFWIPILEKARAAYPGPFLDLSGARLVADRRFVARELAPYLAFGKAKKVPLFLGEFGVLQDGLREGRNGAGWASDVIDLALKAGVSLTYHALHEEYFGFYATPATEPPGKRNEELAEVFARKFLGLTVGR
jgi:hypothetical protein